MLKVEKVKIWKIIFDVLRGKLDKSDAKLAYRFYKIYKKYEEGNLRVKDVFKLKRGDLRRAVPIYNTYTVGTKIDIHLAMDIFDEMCGKVQKFKNDYPHLSKAITNLIRTQSPLKIPKEISSKKL